MSTIYSDNPFSLKIQETDFYSNPIIDQFYSILLNSIGGKDFLILILGEPQSGKTTFFSKLTSEIDQNFKPCQLKIRGSDEPASNNKYPAFFYKKERDQVIILDDAHNLNSQELSIILKNIWDSTTKTKQIIMFCEPQINATISSLLKKMPKKTSVNKFYMPSFDKEQTKSYIKHYFGLANYSRKFPFSEKNIKDIYEKSKGLPGKINHEAYKKFSDKKPSKINSKVIFAIIIFIFFIIEGFVTFKNPDLIQAFDIKKQTSQILITEPNITEQINIAATTTEMFSQKQISNPEPIIIKPQLTESTMINKIGKEEKTIIGSSSFLFQEKWIMIQEPQEYTIQVMASKTEDASDHFLKINIYNQNDIAYYKMYSNGCVWYKFISGKYKTLEKARDACHNLPDKLKNLGPWPRHFASIHNDINKFTKINRTD
jgi:adenylate kinase family enzyme